MGSSRQSPVLWAGIFTLLQLSIDRRVPCDWIGVSHLNNFQCGLLRYDLQEPGSCRPELNFHVDNALQPESMFTDPQYLCICLDDLMRLGEMKYGCCRLVFTSWLNSMRKRLAYFPEEYISSLGPEDDNVRWHYGFWGQFITASGTFNEKYGDILRHTGRMLYYPRRGKCRFATTFVWN